MATTKEINFDSLNDEELLKQEQQMKEMFQKLTEAKKHREENLKSNAFTEITAVIKKYIGVVVDVDTFTDWLDDNEYINTQKFVKTVEIKVAGGLPVGRRKIDDSDILFQKKYVPEGGTRDMTLKLDAQSKKPAIQSGTYKYLKELQKMTFEELKPHFSKKFFEFAKTDASYNWLNIFFPQIVADLDKFLETNEEQAKTEVTM